MPQPLAICIEDLDGRTAEERYLRCVAVVGRQPGLRMDARGTVLWRSGDGDACELWVSGDDRLILYRPESGPRVVCSRDGRSLDVPCGKPVVLLDQDRLDVAGRRLRVHVHGTARVVHAPSPLPSATAAAFPKAAAAALALGAALGAAGCKKQDERPGDVEVRAPTPAVAPAPPDAAAPPDAGSSTAADAVALPDAPPDIEIRVAPPAVPMRMTPPDAEAGTAHAPEDAGPGGAAPEDAAAAPQDAAAEDSRFHRAREARVPIEVRTAPPDLLEKR